MKKSISKLLLAAVLAVVATVPVAGKLASGARIPVAKAEKSKQTKAPGADMPTIYGSLVYFGSSTGLADCGLVEVPTSADAKFNMIYQGAYAPGGGVAVDGIYYCVNYDWSNGATITGYDLNNGEAVCSYQHGYDVVGKLALDPISNEVYGITFRPEMGGYMLSHIKISTTGVTVERIANLTGFWATFAIDSSGQFYGITKENTSGSETNIIAKLYRIDRNTGATTLVGITGQHPYDDTGSVIDPTSDRMFWVVSNGLEGAGLCEVDLSTGQATEIVHFDDDQQVNAMFIPTPVAQKGAPEECKNLSISFDKGSKQGVVKLDAPTYLYDSSTAGSGPLSVIVICNGDQVGYEDVEWGKPAEIPVNLSDFEDGVYNFTIMPIGDGGEGPKSYLNNVYVGVDTPAATSATLSYQNGTVSLNWIPVSGGAHGGWIDASAVTYTVTRADGSVAVKGTSATSFSENVAEPSSISQIYYNVTATAGGLTSAPARSNTVLLGGYLPPYTSNFAQNPNLDYFTIIDGNADGKTWKVVDNKVQCDYNQYENMDDWLIAPPMRLEAGKAYTLKFAANAYMSNSPERVEVKFGTSNTAEGMTETALEPTLITNTSNNPKNLECVIVPDASGIYFIGFHGISDAYMYSLQLSNFTIAEAEGAGIPAVPTNFTVTPDASGALKAVVTLVAPSKSIFGATLNDLSKVEVLRNGAVVKTFDNPAPGATLQFEDVVPADGMYEYSAVAYNEDGKGMAVSTSAFVGQNVPAAPVNVKVSRTSTEGEALISWDAVTVDASAKPVHGDVTYTVYTVSDTGDKTLRAKNIAATEFAYMAASVDDQVFVTAEVIATSSAGNSEAGVSSTVPVGTPYDYFVESFPDGMPLNAWGEKKFTPDAQWQVYNAGSGLEPSDDDDGFAAFYGVARDDSGMLYSGLISLADFDAPALTFWMWNNATTGTANNDIFKILVRSNSEEWTEALATTVDNAVNGREGWCKVSVNFADFAGSDIQIALVGQVVNYNYIFVDNLRFEDLPALDVAAVRITAPVVVKAGGDYTASVKVANLGANATSDYKVTLFVDGKKAETLEGTRLDAGTDRTFDFNLTLSPLQQAAFQIYAAVECQGDADASNNSTSALTINPLASVLPGATSLTAESMWQGVNLKWNAVVIPEGDGDPITQDFEDADSFADNYGNWTFVDMDNSPVGGLKDYEIPGIVNGQTTGSFWVWDTNIMNASGMEAHSGFKCLFSLYRKDGGAADDWAISPELSGDAQTISFWARSLNSSYKEKVEVWYSTGSTDPADFVEIPTAGGKVPATWTKFTAEIPAGAKRFAIRSMEKDAFVLLVDDVTFIPADVLAGSTFEGYDIYRDNLKVGTVGNSSLSYIDTDVVEGTTYSYNVVTVFSTGVGAPSNTVSIQATGVDAALDAAESVKVTARDGSIIVEGAAGRHVVITSLSGIILYNGTPSGTLNLRAANGVYVVKTSDSVKKVRL